MGRDRRRKRKLERRARRQLRRAPKRRRHESGEGASTTETPESWLDLARRFIRHEGGAVHITHPALDLLARYGYDTNTAIYGHFSRVGEETDARSYLRVGDSPSDERIAVQDALVIWRWGEADHDPELSVVEEFDADA